MTLNEAIEQSEDKFICLGSLELMILDGKFYDKTYNQHCFTSTDQLFNKRWYLKERK